MKTAAATLVIFVTLVVGFTGSSIAAGTELPPGTNVQPSSAYVAPTAAGTKLGQYNIARFKEIVKRGLSDGATGKKAQVEPETQMDKINALAQARSSAGADKEKVAGREFVDKAAKEPGATKLPSGVVYKTLTPGTGPTPGDGSARFSICSIACASPANAS